MPKTTKTPAVKTPVNAGATPTQTTRERIKTGLYDVPLEYITPSPTNPRKHFDTARLEELAASIRVQGLVSPITVRPIGGTAEQPRFELVAGERRWRACRLAEMERIQCVVRELSDIETIEIQIIENDQRVDVSPLEKARAINQLHDLGLSWADIAEKLGRSESNIRDTAILTRAPKPLADAMEAGQVSTLVVEMVCRIPSELLRDELAEAILADPDSPLGAVSVRHLIENKYQVGLWTAKFDRKSLTLVPQAGCCTKCPKRAFNLANEDPSYINTRADICTDPYCFTAKAKASLVILQAKAKQNGDTVFDRKQSDRAMSHFAHLDFSQEFFDLDKPMAARTFNYQLLKPEHRKSKVKTLLVGETFKKVLLHTDKYEPIWAVRQDVAMGLLVARGFADPLPEDSQPKSEAAQPAQAPPTIKLHDAEIDKLDLPPTFSGSPKIAAKVDLVREVVEGYMDEDGIGALIPSTVFGRAINMMCRHIIGSAMTSLGIVSRLGIERNTRRATNAEIARWAATKTPTELIAAAMAVVAEDSTQDDWSGVTFEEILDFCEIDPETEGDS